MAARRGRTITSFGQAFPSLSGGSLAFLEKFYETLEVRVAIAEAVSVETSEDVVLEVRGTQTEVLVIESWDVVLEVVSTHTVTVEMEG